MTPSKSSQCRFAIVGGGFLGMTLAYRLARAGCQVTLIEAASDLGGLAGTWQLGDVQWDRHYHVTLFSDSHNRSLLNELGIDDEMEWVQTRTGYFAGGRLHSISNSLEYLLLPAIGACDKFRLATTIRYAAGMENWRALEKIRLTDWLSRMCGTRVLERFWMPLLRAKLGEHYRDASAAFIWAVIRRLYAARHSGLKKEMFGYMPGGYGRTIDTFKDAIAVAGVSIELGEPVRAVRQCSEGLEVQRGDSTTIFDKVVVTTTCSQAQRLCGDLNPDEKTRLQNVRYMGIVCASLLLRNPLAEYYLTYLMDSWIPFTAVVEMSAMVDRKYFGGRSLVYLPKYVAPDDPLLGTDDGSIREQFLDALERMYAHFRRSDVLAFRVSRVREVFAIPTVNYSNSLPPIATSVPGLYIANSAHIVNGTLNVNETVQLANSVAEMLLTGELRGFEAPRRHGGRREEREAMRGEVVAQGARS